MTNIPASLFLRPFSKIRNFSFVQNRTKYTNKSNMSAIYPVLRPFFFLILIAITGYSCKTCHCPAYGMNLTSPAEYPIGLQSAGITEDKNSNVGLQITKKEASFLFDPITNLQKTASIY
jgi:hypothetical protein